MTVAERDQKAQELRARGLTYKEIAERLGGRDKAAAWKWCNRERENERSKRWKREHRDQVRAYDRQYGEENRVACPRCGYLYGKKSGTKRGTAAPAIDFSMCPGCIKARSDQIEGWWAEGLTIRQIAEQMGWTPGHVGVEINRLRAQGYELPYRHMGEVGGTKFPHLRKAA